MNNEKLFKFCLFLYKLKRKSLFVFLNSLPSDCLIFVLSELVFFGFFLAKFILKVNLAKLTKSEFFFYSKLLKRGFVFSQRNKYLNKHVDFFKKYSVSNFVSKFIINKTKNFKKDLLVSLLGRVPIIGLYERREYIKKYGYNQNYNSKRNVHLNEESVLNKMNLKNVKARNVFHALKRTKK